MTGASEARVTQRAEEVAEEVASAANIVTNAGYYEIDIDAVTAVIARFEAEVTQSATAPLIEAVEAAREALVEAQVALPVLRTMLRAARLGKGAHQASLMLENSETALTRLTAALAAQKGEG